MIMLLNRTIEWMSVELHAGLVPIYFDCNKLIAKTSYCTIDYRNRYCRGSDDCNRYLGTLLQIAVLNFENANYGRLSSQF
jgi:hypothetical protein